MNEPNLDALRHALCLLLSELQKLLGRPGGLEAILRDLANEHAGWLTNGERSRLMTTTEAARYCGVSPAMIRYGVAKGRLKIAGRRGGTRLFVFERTELDAFMRGDTERRASPTPQARPPIHRARAQPRAQERTRVLERLRALRVHPQR